MKNIFIKYKFNLMYFILQLTYLKQKNEEFFDSFQLSSKQRPFTNFSDSILINFCVFLRSHTFQGSGSILFIQKNSFQLNLINSYFYNCSTNKGDGGAIYFEGYSSSSKSKMKNICASYCLTSKTNLYQFGLVFIQENINTIEFISINRCSFNLNSGKYPLKLENGRQEVKNLNSSFNQVQSESGFGNSHSLMFVFEFSTFHKNNCLNGNCISLEVNQNNIIKNLNIIENNSPNNGAVLLFKLNGDKLIENVIFQNNLDKLLFIQEGLLTLLRCGIKFNTETLSYYGSIKFENSQINLIQTIEISHFSTYFCILSFKIVTNIKDINLLSGILFKFLFILIL